MPFNSEDPPLPPEGKLDNLLTDPAWQYYNKRVAEMGLASREAIDDNCIRFCPANQLAKHGITSKFTQNRPAILFQYLDMNGRPTENMYQARMIGDPPSFVAPPPGLEMEEYKSRLRKAFPKYLGGRYFDAYFPRLPSAIFTGAVATWVDQKVVFITEGIPKAIRMTQAGLPCISIQGKDMFKYKNGELVEGLQKFLLKSNVEKIIYIADSDARHNQEIRDSAIYLVGLLSANRPHEFASWVMLPETEGFEKTGVDDLLNSKGVQYFLKEFKGWMQEWMGGAWFATFHEISKLLLFVAGSTNFVYLPMRRVISSSSASHIVQPILSTQRGLVNPYSGSKVRPVNLTSTFLSEPSRRTVDGVNFWPGMPEILFKDHENENEDNS
jgi:hypothetical protein